MVRGLVGSLMLVALAVGLLAYWRRPAARYGKYVGISTAASQGASFDESRMDFVYDEKGLVLDSPVESGGMRYAFKTSFTPEWITHPVAGWGLDRGVAIRQHRTSDLAQVIFLFRRDFGWRDVDVVMLLGEGMPMPLAVFVRAERPDAIARLQRIYDQIKGPTPEPYDALTPVPETDAKAFSALDATQKRKLMHDTGHNLWTGTHEEIRRRLDILALGMDDSVDDVQEEALSQFRLGARVSPAVDMVVGFLERADTRPYVVDAAIGAAACLLHEVHYSGQDTESLEKEYGTADIAEIFKRTDGVLKPEHHETIQKLAHRPADRTWTSAQKTALRRAIEDAADRLQARGYPVPHDTERVLADYR